jgi:hypothetical protein
MKGRRLPQRERPRSLAVPMRIAVRVETTAVIETIQDTALGSGVMRSYMKVL